MGLKKRENKPKPKLKRKIA